jgi:hypothetical protein
MSGNRRVLYEAAVGRRAFEEYEDDEEYPQRERRAPAVTSRRRLPAALAQVIDACLEPRQEGGPTTDELLDAFQRISDQLAPARTERTVADG